MMKTPNFIRNFFKGIKNLIVWFPIIWKDRDFDYIYLLIIMRKKLELMEHLFKYDSYKLNSKKDAEEIEQCINYLNNIINDDYHDIFDGFYKKWGEPGLFDYHQKSNYENHDEYIKEFKECCEKERQLLENDVNELFENMRKNILKWWD